MTSRAARARHCLRGFGRGRGSRDGRLLGQPRRVRGPVRPAALADLQASARHHRGGVVEGHRRVHRLHQGLRRRSRADHPVPAGRVDAARPQDGSAAAAGRRGGRGRPRAARGPRPPVRPPHAVPRVQAGRCPHLHPAGGGAAPPSALGDAGAAVRRAAAGGDRVDRPGRPRAARRGHPRAQAGAGALAGPPARSAGERARAGPPRRRPAATRRGAPRSGRWPPTPTWSPRWRGSSRCSSCSARAC